jgi:predicted MFS family arabinose efflux permease
MRALSAPVILVLWVNPGLAVAFMAYVGRNILGQITGVLENTFSMEIVPAQMRAAVASWRTFSYNVGWSVASVIAGVVVVHLGFDPIFLASALLTLAGAATWYQRFGRRASLARFPLHSAADRPSV